MAPYSMDLRERVAAARQEGIPSDMVAAMFAVSRAWVDRLMQRLRETGSLEPRRQTKFRERRLAAQADRLRTLVEAQPDITLAELRAALPTTAGLATLCREVRALGFTLKKNGTRRRTAPR